MMVEVLSVAESIKTPMMLAALALLVLLLIIRLLLKNIGLDRVRVSDAGKVALATVRGVFWLAIILGSLSIGAYVLTTIFDPRSGRVLQDVEAIGSASEPVRVKSIASLERFTRRDSSMDHEICEALTSFLRSGDRDSSTLWSVYPPDRQSALDLVAKLAARRGCRDVNLGEADLRRSNLAGMKLRGAVLSGTLLDEASFRKADVSEASLAGSSLRGTDFSGAKAVNADFRRATFDETIFDCADLSRAHGFAGEDLVSTSFEGARLTGVDFTDARLSVRLKGVGGATC